MAEKRAQAEAAAELVKSKLTELMAASAAGDKNGQAAITPPAEGKTK